MRIAPLDARDPAARRLLDLSDVYMASLYPPEANSMESVDDLGRPNVEFLGCYVDDRLAACGAVKVVGDADRYGEIKRLFVDEPFRGRGLSRILMAELERRLLARGVRTVRLEVGISQPEALGLYAALGYGKRARFGAYTDNPYSVFMEKQLKPAAHAR